MNISHPEKQIILGLEFRNISTDHGEQYDVYDNNDQVGYVSAIKGWWKVICPDHLGKFLLEDRYTELFDNQIGFTNATRILYLEESARRIRSHLLCKKN